MRAEEIVIAVRHTALTEAKRSALPQEPAATVEGIRAAYAALSDAQLLKLERYARWKTRGLERIGGSGFCCDELLADALIRILQGERKWYPARVSFFGFFHGVLRSISGQWYEHLKSRRADFEVQNRRVVAVEDGGRALLDPLEQIADAAVSAEDAIYARQMVERARARFAEDEPARAILEGWLAGSSPSEIREELGMTATEFETAQRRLTRGLRTLVPEAESTRSGEV